MTDSPAIVHAFMASPHPLLAFWQLGSAAMLLWGLAAALPILIHLWSRRRYQPERWAAMTFLLAALRTSARRMQLEQAILLAVRAAILLLFAIALADPQWSGTTQTNGDNALGSRHTVLVIDTSYSMDFRDSDRSRFDTAKVLARQLVAGGQQGDGFSLVLMAEPPRIVIAQPTFDREDFAQELDDLRLTHAGASLAETLAEVESILRRAAERHPQFALHRVFIFTDMQQATWSEVNAAEMRSRLRRLESLAAFEIVDLGQPQEENIAVVDLQVDQPLLAAPGDARIQCAIQSFGRDERRGQAVALFVDGHRVAERHVDVPGGGQATVAVSHRFESPGDHLIEARLADDALPLDNRRWLSVPVRESIRVLCVGGRPGETRHLALALAPRRSMADSLSIVEAPESRLLEHHLAQFDCVFLCNIGRISAAEADVLRRFVHRGGGLVVFLGDQVQPQSYNELLAGAADSRVLPARLQEAVKSGTYRVDPLDYRHPIVAPFRDFEQAGLLTTPIWKYIRLAALEDAQVAAALGTGDPLIVEGKFGRGRSVLFATAASPQSLDQSNDPPTPWTAFSVWPSFPPLVHETLHESLAGHSEVRNLVVGEELTSTPAATATEQVLSITGPEGLDQRLHLDFTDDEARWRFAANISGVYEIHGQEPVQRFAVNVNPRESDLARLDPKLLPSQFSRGPLDQVDEEAMLPAGNAAAYFRWLLGVVLALLVAEPCLAWHFGGRRG